jgi:hypothetical protein
VIPMATLPCLACLRDESEGSAARSPLDWRAIARRRDFGLAGIKTPTGEKRYGAKVETVAKPR